MLWHLCLQSLSVCWGRPHLWFRSSPPIRQFADSFSGSKAMRGKAAAFLDPCGPREVAAEKVTALVQSRVKGVVGRAGRVKEVRCPDLSPCRRNKQGFSSGTICEQAHCCPGTRGVTCSSPHCSDAAPAALVPLFPSISRNIGSDNFSKAFRNMCKETSWYKGN